MEKKKVKDHLGDINSYGIQYIDISSKDKLWELILGKVENPKYEKYYLDYSGENYFEIYGIREETDEELEKRVIAEKNWKKEQKILDKQKEEKERAEYERLKKKFES